MERMIRFFVMGGFVALAGVSARGVQTDELPWKFDDSKRTPPVTSEQGGDLASLDTAVKSQGLAALSSLDTCCFGFGCGVIDYFDSFAWPGFILFVR